MTSSERPTGEEIAAYAAGVADPATTRRVTAALLTDAAARAQYATFRAAIEWTAPAAEAEATVDTARLQRVRTAMCEEAQAAGREGASTASGGGVLNDLAKAGEAVRAALSRVLLTGRQLLTLPCLAPAAAASAPDLALRKQTVTTGEGVRIEFQQLPGGPPQRVRIVVDAAALRPAEAGEKEDGPPPPPIYNVAYLTLEEGEPVSGRLPDRHVLVVALNAQGRGFTDFTIGGERALGTGLPAPQAPLALVSATLAQVAEASAPGS
jgi:hypothetical protein